MWDWLSNVTDWFTSQLNDVEQILSAPIQSATPDSVQETVSETQGFLYNVWAALFVSPAECLNHFKVEIGQKLLDLQEFSFQLCSAAGNVSKAVLQQVLFSNHSQYRSALQIIYFLGFCG